MTTTKHEKKAKQDSDLHCPKSPTKQHEPDGFSAVQAPFSLVLDLNCKHCGRSGSVTIDPKEILW